MRLSIGARSRAPGDAPPDAAAVAGGLSGSGPALSLTGATIGYGVRPVVLGADLTVARGESVGLLGANGSGKTTLVRGLIGLADVLAGQVRVAGRPVGDRTRRQLVGYVPQRLAPPSGVPTTAAEVVAAGLLAGGRHLRPAPGGRRAVAAALTQVGLSDIAHVPVAELSGGQHRRVLIARALISDPPLLLLDEPTAGVDRASVQALVATLGRLRAEGRTLLVVTHELEELAAVVDRVVSIVDGRLVTGTVPGRAVGGH
ncbi:MAG: metal ABC transporter ATP-binding protein [Kineosporiaceae bacterium]